MQFVSCFINLCQTRERRNTFPWWPKWNSYTKRCPDISNMLRLAAVTNRSTCRDTCHNYAEWKDNYGNNSQENFTQLLSPFFWLKVWKTSKPMILVHVGCLTHKSQNYINKTKQKANILLPLACPEQEHSKLWPGLAQSLIHGLGAALFLSQKCWMRFEAKSWLWVV